MGIKNFKSVTPGRRNMTVSDFAEITTDKPYKPLLVPIKKSGGHNNFGRTTVRHRGGGHKRMYRIIDFKRDKTGIPAKVLTIEYDPNRSARIALVVYSDGEKRYILAPYGLKVGDAIVSSENAEIKVGNTLPLKKIPVGTIIHNIELHIGKGGQLARSAGAYAQIAGKEGDYALLKLPSGELRKIHLKCKATIGQVSNIDHENIVIGKAGRKRWLGIRPTVRGVAMNPVDHPHGGGEGRQKGYPYPMSPWGKNSKGKRTRHNKRTDRFIVKRREKRR